MGFILPRPIQYLLAVLGLAAAVAGCSQSASPPSPIPPAAGAETGVSLADRESWDIFRIQGSRLGSGRTTLRHATEDGRTVLKVEQTMTLTVKRFGDSATIEMRYADTETPDGQLLGFESEMRQGPTPTRTVGRVQGDRLFLEITTEGQRQQMTVPWTAGLGGMLAPDLSLLREPMKPGQRRTVRHFTIADNQVSETEMTAGQEESVQLLAGSFRLLRIDCVERLSGGQKIKGVFWTDASGESMKSWQEPMNMESIRVPKDVATAKTEPPTVDLGRETLVPVSGPLPDRPHDCRQIRYRVHLDGSDPSEVFVSGPSQQVKRIDANTAELTVYAIRPGRNDGNPDARQDPPTDADRKPNNFIQSDDARIVADAQAAAGAETDPWRVAVALERFVHDAVKQKDFTQAFATAAEVARTREGDCTEHSVYLAALARARGIPARVAIGLVCVSGTLGYHMWTEVYVDGRWIAVDGTLAKGGIGAGHLKLTQSSLAGAAAYSSFLPVVQVIGRLKVEVLDSVQP
jgi:hypothetical protein